MCVFGGVADGDFEEENVAKQKIKNIKERKKTGKMEERGMVLLFCIKGRLSEMTKDKRIKEESCNKVKGRKEQGETGCVTEDRLCDGRGHVHTNIHTFLFSQ